MWRGGDGADGAFTINWEGFRIGFGARDGETYDILFLPVEDPKEAAKKLAQAETRVVIPYSQSEEATKRFLKERGEKGEEMEKLTIKKKEIDAINGQKIICLSSK